MYKHKHKTFFLPSIKIYMNKKVKKKKKKKKIFNKKIFF